MTQLSRRQFFSSIAKPVAAASLVMAHPALMSKALAAVKNTAGRPEDIAKDESYWLGIQQAYTADRSMINLNNGRNTK